MCQKSYHFVALHMVVVETQWKKNFGYHMTVRPVYKLNVCVPQLATLICMGRTEYIKKVLTHIDEQNTHMVIILIHTHSLLFLCKCKIFKPLSMPTSATSITRQVCNENSGLPANLPEQICLQKSVLLCKLWPPVQFKRSKKEM